MSRFRQAAAAAQFELLEQPGSGTKIVRVVQGRGARIELEKM